MIKDYSINCCGVMQPSDTMVKMAMVFDRASATYEGLLNKAIAQEIFGNNTCAFDDVNDYNYLIFLLHLMCLEQVDYYEANNELPSFTYMNTKYNIECLITSFKRKNIDIKPLLEAIEIWPKLDENDGINYMIVDGNSNPINRVI